MLCDWLIDPRKQKKKPDRTRENTLPLAEKEGCDETDLIFLLADHLGLEVQDQIQCLSN